MDKVGKKETTIESILFTHYESRDPAKIGTHPVKIKVTHNRKTQYYPVQFKGQNIFLSPDQWAKVMDKRPPKEYRPLNNAIKSAEVSANSANNKIRQGNKLFSFDRFNREFLHQESEHGLLSLFEKSLSELKTAGRFGTHYSYNNAYIAFKKFRAGKEIMPEDLTPQVLQNFEAYLKKEKPEQTKKNKTIIRSANKTTIAIYMRALKTVLNIAISTNPALAEFYPFAKKQNDTGKYKIKSGSGHKGLPLSIAQLQKLIESTPAEQTQEWEAKLLWLFSFYAQGMNYKDLFFLRNKDIQADAIRYVRKKTQETESNEQVMAVPLSDQLLDIIGKIGNKDKTPTAYVFKCLQPGMDAFTAAKAIRQKTKLSNKWLQSLCSSIGLPPVTSYWSRHSYAQLLKESGQSTEMIQELLGHGDPRTTENYLKRFDLDKKKKVNEKLNEMLKVS